MPPATVMLWSMLKVGKIAVVPSGAGGCEAVIVKLSGSLATVTS